MYAGRGDRAHGYLPGTSPVYIYGDPVLVRGEEELDSAKRERTRPARFPNACGAHGMTSTAGEEGQRGNSENEY